MDMNSVPTVIFPTIMCRICIECSENVQNIEETFVSYEDKVLPLLELLNLFSNIELSTNHPNSICFNCISKATEAYQFKLQCDKSTQILHEMKEAIVSEVTIKDPNVEEEYKIEENVSEITPEDAVEIKTEPNEDNKENKVKIQPYACCFCSETFDYLANYRDHIQTHKADLFAEEEHKCTKCGECLPHAWGLRVHLVTCDGEKPHKCWHCGQSFLIKKKLRIHQATECKVKPYVCKLCNKQFKKACLLKHHTMQHNNERPYICNICGKKYITNAERRGHIRSRHEGLKRKRPESERLKQFLCPFCGVSFARNYQLNTHLELHSKEKQFQCEKCGKIFALITGLRAHYVVHEDEKPFECKVCGKGFPRKYSLTKHEFTHMGFRPHACQICDKAFKDMSTLKTHIRIHTNEQMICAICGKGFSRNNILQQHIIEKHSNSDVSTATEVT